MRSLLILILVFLPILSFGQGKVTRQETNNNSSQSTSTTQNTTHKPSSSNAKKKTTTPPIKISLATEINGQRKYFSTTEWKNLSGDERIKYNKIGVVIKSQRNEFLIALNNNMSNGIYNKGVSQLIAVNKTQGNLPTSDQLRIITRNLTKINSALSEFGGEPFCAQPYWAKDGSNIVQVDLGNHGLNKPYDGMFRISSNDIEKGFDEKEVVSHRNESYDFVGEKSNTQIQVVRHKDKYGFIKNGDIIIPIEYDEVGYNYDWQNKKNGNDNIRWDYSVLMSVSKNGKWGFINKNGELVTPLIYDSLDDMSHTDNTPVWVCKDGRYGCVDTLGNYKVPLVYEDEIHFYNFISAPSRAKRNGKWGFINKIGEVTIPFKFDSTRGFRDKAGLAQVSINGKFGYINLSGEEVIPVKYEFADDFENGLAGIVSNGKVGFIDVKGNLIIPCVYELEYSSDGDGKKLSWNDFSYGGVALVKQNNKWGIINKKGEKVTDFIYDRFSSAGSGGRFTAKLNGKDVFLDKGGNQFASKEERSEKSDSILAYQGYPYEQYKMGKPYYKSKDYNKAYLWFKKSAEGGDDDGQCHLGYYYYYGYSPINRSDYATAFSWFSKAADVGNSDACYFLGWMYEHGQGVPTNKLKAVEWYKKSNGERDAKERIETLSK